MCILTLIQEESQFDSTFTKLQFQFKFKLQTIDFVAVNN